MTKLRAGEEGEAVTKPVVPVSSAPDAHSTPPRGGAHVMITPAEAQAAMAEAENVALNGGDTATQLGASAMISLATDYHKATGGATDDAYVQCWSSDGF